MKTRFKEAICYSGSVGLSQICIDFVSVTLPANACCARGADGDVLQVQDHHLPGGRVHSEVVRPQVILLGVALVQQGLQGHLPRTLLLRRPPLEVIGQRLQQVHHDALVAEVWEGDGTEHARDDHVYLVLMYLPYSFRNRDYVPRSFISL